MSVIVSVDDFSVSQLDAIFGLFSSYFKQDDKLLTKSYSEWLYGKNPAGLARMVFALDEGRLIGFMGLIPVHLARLNDRTLAYYVVNVLVHPAFHGKHIFGRMITAAKDLARNEDTVLMGHPNSLAIVSWKRAKMHFQAPLKPHLVLPRLPQRGTRIRNIERVSDLESFWAMLSAQTFNSEFWSLAVSSEYLEWRYISHPINKYNIRSLEVKGKSAGFTITRNLRFGVNLLIDFFSVDGNCCDAMAGLPWFTVAFRQEESILGRRKVDLLLPIKKTLPVFFTSYRVPAITEDVRLLGLSASDF